MSTPVSYLQTLPKNEATTFVASLQKVKDHLSEELEWMTQQVQQKTTQLQGIEAILAEVSDVEPASRKPTVPPESSTPLAAVASALSDAEGTADEPAVKESNHQIAANSVKPTGKVKPAANSKAAAAKAGKTNGTRKSTGKPGRASGSVDLRELLVAEFQGQTFTDSVAQILESVPQPIHLKELLARLYGKLSDSDYERARISLAKVLSTGKSEGKWQALGQGMYAGKVGATR